MTTTPEPDNLDLQFQSPRDSAYASPGWSPGTVSVRSETLQYRELGGRVYGPGFPFPIDERAKDNHDLQNAVFEKVLKKDYHAPVDLNGARVLELFTRTGILAISIADKDPSCIVTGIDESNTMQASLGPPNVEFEICDLEDDTFWTWRQPFRLIIIRQFGGFVKDLPSLIRRCHNFLEDGGWIEFQLLALQHHSQQPSMNEGSKIRELHHHLSNGLAALGRKLDIQDDLAQTLEENSFHHLEHFQRPVPLGMWPKNEELKDIGRYWWLAFYRQLEGLTLLSLMEGLNWNDSNYQLFLMEVRNELGQQARLQMETKLHVFYAQKMSN